MNVTVCASIANPQINFSGNAVQVLVSANNSVGTAEGEHNFLYKCTTTICVCLEYLKASRMTQVLVFVASSGEE